MQVYLGLALIKKLMKCLQVQAKHPLIYRMKMFEVAFISVLLINNAAIFIQNNSIIFHQINCFQK